MILQACQIVDVTGQETSEPSLATGPAPSQLSDPKQNKDITLTRPNTVLLHATVAGGKAYRGLFMGAMANEIASADNVTDIYEMFRKAATKMKKGAPACVLSQIPKFETTADKKLVLPAEAKQADNPDGPLCILL